MKNRQFNDSVASVDRRLLEKAKQIHQIRPARATAGEEGEDVAQVTKAHDWYYQLSISQPRFRAEKNSSPWTGLLVFAEQDSLF